MGHPERIVGSLLTRVSPPASVAAEPLEHQNAYKPAYHAHCMARATTTRLQRYGGNRHCIYLRSDFVNDSAFPFQPGDRLTATIHDDHVTLHKE